VLFVFKIFLFFFICFSVTGTLPGMFFHPHKTTLREKSFFRFPTDFSLGGFSKPNHLYVKIPSDEIGLQPVDDKAVEKMAVIEPEKHPSSGHKNGCAEAGNVAPK